MKSIPWVFGMIVSLAWAKPPAVAEPAPKPVEVTPYVSELRVLQAAGAKGQWVLRIGDNGGGRSGPHFWGDGKQFYELETLSGSSTGSDVFSIRFWDPRFKQASLERRGDEFSVTCGSKKVVFRAAPDTEQAKVLQAAKFWGAPFMRVPLGLARDDSGRYVYVDRLKRASRDEAETGFRVFFGKRGAMKLTALKEVAQDSGGYVFSTQSGDFRIQLGAGNSYEDALWIHKKKTVKLKQLNPEDNEETIFVQLGVYDGVRLGTPCDDL